MKFFSLIFVLCFELFAIGCTEFKAVDSPTLPLENWKISLGEVTGYYHDGYEKFEVDGNGELVYRKKLSQSFISESKKDDETVLNGKAKPEDIQKIGVMLAKLELAKAKKLTGEDYDSCVNSLHSKQIYFELKQLNVNYGFSHCDNSVNNSGFDYTVILSNEQKEIYTSLRKKVTLIFDEIRKQVSSDKEQNRNK